MKEREEDGVRIFRYESIDELLAEADERDRQRKAAREAAKEAEREEAAERGRRLHGFAEHFTPMKRARVLEVLERLQCFDGVTNRRHAAIEDRVRDGWRVVTGTDGRRRFTSPEGAYLPEMGITKIGMDYAEYLEARLEDLEQD